MADNSIMVFNLPDNALAGLGEMGKVFGSPDDDAERVPNVEARVTMLKVLNNAQQFKIDETKMDNFNGILLHFNATRSWWEKSMDEGGGGNAPDCHSVDGIKPLANSPKKQSDLCNNCPRNRFVAGENGKKSKACQDKIELFFYNPKHELPLLMRASTMNRKPVVDFIEKCAEIGVRKEMLIIKLGLFETRNKGGVKYDGLKIEVVGTVQTLADFFNNEQKTKDNTPQTVAKTVLDFKQEHEEVFGTYISEEAASVVQDANNEEEGSDEQEPAPKQQQKASEPANTGYKPPF